MTEGSTTRRQLIAGAAAGAALYGLPTLAFAQRGGRHQRDIDILNFALNLEYLDAEYYTLATTGRGLADSGVDITGAGNQGATRGGGRVDFRDAEVEAMARQIAADERAQIMLIRNTIKSLGGTPIAKPALDLTAAAAMGIDPMTIDGYLLATRAFEDTAVTAYGGTARFLTNPGVIQGTSRILAAEAYHSGAVRREIVRRRLVARPLDPIDVPPGPDERTFFPIDVRTGQPPIRTPEQVLRVVTMGSGPRGGFFPEGPNGNLPAVLRLR